MKYLDTVVRNFPVSTSDLRANLLKLLLVHPSGNSLDDDKLHKLNDSLYTYSYQFASQFNLVNFSLDGYCLPTNLCKLVIGPNNELKKFDDIAFCKIFLLTDKTSAYGILPLVSKEQNLTLAKIIHTIAKKSFDKNINNSNLFVEGVESFINLLLESKLLCSDEKGFLSVDNSKLSETISSSVWMSSDEFSKAFSWSDFISAYNYCVNKTAFKKINIQLIVSLISLKYNTIVLNIIPMIKKTPASYENKKIYLIQGRLSSTDSIEIAGALYNSVEIE